MPASLADVSILVVSPCEPGAFRWSVMREFHRIWRDHGYPHECARVILAGPDRNTREDVAEIVYDPWLHSGLVVYGRIARMVSGRDPETVAHAWLPRARAEAS